MTKREHLRAYLGETVAELARKKVIRLDDPPSEIAATLVKQFAIDVGGDLSFVLAEGGRFLGSMGIRMAQTGIRERAGRGGKVVDALADMASDWLSDFGKSKP